MVDQPVLCSSSEQLNDTHQGCVGGILVQQEIPGLGVKQEGDAHVDHQGVLENPKWEIWLDPALVLVGSSDSPYFGLQTAREDCAGVETPATWRPGGRERLGRVT